MAKIGPFLEDELARRRVVDARPEDVGGEQVGRELDPPERAVDARGQGPRQERLADPGHVLDQDVPLGQERDHRELDDFGLAQDHRADVIQQPVQQRHQFVRRRERTSRMSGVNSCGVLRTVDSPPAPEPRHNANRRHALIRSFAERGLRSRTRASFSICELRTDSNTRRHSECSRAPASLRAIFCEEFVSTRALRLGDICDATPYFRPT